MNEPLSSDLADRIRRQCGENVYLCYQCQKCSSGCPAAEYFDLAPNQLMRALQLGQKERVLKARTLWLCAMCETCAVRCPHDINITRVMDVLKIMAQREGLASPLPTAVLFNRAALRGIRHFGRMFEAGLMGEMYLRQMLAGTLDFGQLWKSDLPLALQMLKKGRLKLLPSISKFKAPVKAGEKKEGIAYYPGCSLHGTSSEYNVSSKAVLARLGVALREPEKWNCCGSTPAHSTDHYLSLLLPLRNLLSMERAGFERITTPCPSCFIRLRTAQLSCNEENVKEKLEGELGDLPSPDLHISHLLQTVTEEIGLKRVRKEVTHDLAGIKVVCYYGCIITRPPKITGVKDYENPTQMDGLMRTLGAEPLDWSYKTRCCGATLSITQPAIALELTRKILKNARDVGAEAVVVACPLCQINLDARQDQIETEGEKFHLPILYFTQLMGLAFGLTARDMELHKHFVKAAPIVEKIQRLSSSRRESP